MDALIIENDEVKGIETNTGQTLLGPVILATGHSARDVYRWLAANGVEIEAKGIAVGVRLEHPASLIDRIQIPQPQRTRQIPARRRVQLRYPSGRKRRVQLLHVSGRICRSGSQRASPAGGKRHESQQPWHEVEQLRHGGRIASRRPAPARLAASGV